jgi:hypothetical protein
MKKATLNYWVDMVTGAALQGFSGHRKLVVVRVRRIGEHPGHVVRVVFKRVRHDRHDGRHGAGGRRFGRLRRLWPLPAGLPPQHVLV